MEAKLAVLGDSSSSSNGALDAAQVSATAAAAALRLGSGELGVGPPHTRPAQAVVQWAADQSPPTLTGPPHLTYRAPPPWPPSLPQAAQLAAHPAWQRSGFESLERFIFQFLTGSSGAGSGSSNGASAGGRAAAESVRLKLEASSGGDAGCWGQ